MLGPCFVMLRLKCLSVLSNFAIISLRKTQQLVAKYFVFFCHVADHVLCLFLTVQWVGLWSMIVAFPGHTHLLF